MTGLAIQAAATNPTLTRSLEPLVGTLVTLAGLVAVFFIVWGGFDYLTSRGQPDKLARAKQTIVRALSGLVLVLAAGWLVNFLTSSYQPATTTGGGTLPTANWPAVVEAESGLVASIIDGLVGLGRHIISSLGQPVIDLLSQLTDQTPMLGQNPVIGRLWLVSLGLANSLLVLVVVLLGFGVMTGPSLGLGGVGLRPLIPKLAATFLAMNLSLVLAETLIGLSNALIRGFRAAVPTNDLWASLRTLTELSDGTGLAGLLLLGLVIVLGLALVIYYLIRLVQLYLGAVLAPLVILLGLLPPLRDFAYASFRAYLSTVFVLFIHVVLLGVGASLFSVLPQAGGLVDLLVAAALLIVLLKTPKVLGQLNYLSLGSRNLVRLGDMLASGLGQVAGQLRTVSRSYRAGRGL